MAVEQEVMEFRADTRKGTIELVGGRAFVGGIYNVDLLVDDEPGTSYGLVFYATQGLAKPVCVASFNYFIDPITGEVQDTQLKFDSAVIRALFKSTSGSDLQSVKLTAYLCAGTVRMEELGEEYSHDISAKGEFKLWWTPVLSIIDGTPIDTKGEKGDPGETYIPELYETGGEVYVRWLGSDGTIVEDEVNIKGPQGVQGETGSQGIPGEKGMAGETYVPEVVEDEEGAYLIFHHSGGTLGSDVNLKGPQGDKGDTGATGATGPAGAKGDNGATGPQGIQGPEGKSAYEIAVENGYDGTEAEYAELTTSVPENARRAEKAAEAAEAAKTAAETAAGNADASATAAEGSLAAVNEAIAEIEADVDSIGNWMLGDFKVISHERGVFVLELVANITTTPGVVMCSDGQHWIFSFENHRTYIVDKDLKVLREFKFKSAHIHDAPHNARFGVVRNGVYYVPRPGDRLRAYSMESGSLISTYTGFSIPYTGMSVLWNDRTGHLLYATSSNVYIFDAQLNLLETRTPEGVSFTNASTFYVNGNTYFQPNTGDVKNRLFVLDDNDDAVLVTDSAGDEIVFSDTLANAGVTETSGYVSSACFAVGQETYVGTDGTTKKRVWLTNGWHNYYVTSETDDGFLVFTKKSVCQYASSENFKRPTGSLVGISAGQSAYQSSAVGYKWANTFMVGANAAKLMCTPYFDTQDNGYSTKDRFFPFCGNSLAGGVGTPLRCAGYLEGSRYSFAQNSNYKRANDIICFDALFRPYYPG